MVLEAPGRPLVATTLPDPRPTETQVLIRGSACAVCRTDLHVVDGELPRLRAAVVPGHEIVGVVRRGRGRASRASATSWRSWATCARLGWTCGVCSYCRSSRENPVRPRALHGRRLTGVRAELTVAPTSAKLPASRAGGVRRRRRPRCCARLIGYRALRMAGDARRVGLYGFGAAAHIIIQVARHEGREVHAFTRPGDAASARFGARARRGMGGRLDESAPPSRSTPRSSSRLWARLDGRRRSRTSPRAAPSSAAGIHMSDIPSFPVRAPLGRAGGALGGEPRSAAGRGSTFLALGAALLPVKTTTTRYPLAAEANAALDDLRHGLILEGAGRAHAGLTTEGPTPTSCWLRHRAAAVSLTALGALGSV